LYFRIKGVTIHIPPLRESARGHPAADSFLLQQSPKNMANTSKDDA